MNKNTILILLAFLLSYVSYSQPRVYAGYGITNTFKGNILYGFNHFTSVMATVPSSKYTDMGLSLNYHTDKKSFRPTTFFSVNIIKLVNAVGNDSTRFTFSFGVFMGFASLNSEMLNINYGIPLKLGVNVKRGGRLSIYAMANPQVVTTKKHTTLIPYYLGTSVRL